MTTIVEAPLEDGNEVIAEDAAIVSPQGTITIDDSPNGVLNIRLFGATVTTDTNPGVIVTLDQPYRLLNGDTLIKDANGAIRFERR
jgi:hypothetical protein